MKSIPYVQYINDEVVTTSNSFDRQFSQLYKRTAFGFRFLILLYLHIITSQSIGLLIQIFTSLRITHIENQVGTLLKAVNYTNQLISGCSLQGNTIRERQEFMRGYFQRLDDNGAN
jgi:hypothetical protein